MLRRTSSGRSGSGVAFFGVYPTMNWLTSLRPRAVASLLSRGAGHPVRPAVHLGRICRCTSLFVLPLFFIPAERMPALGKQLIAGSLIERRALSARCRRSSDSCAQVPDARRTRRSTRGVFSIDRPYNLVPSLHVIFSTAIALACADFARPLRARRAAGLARRHRRLDGARPSASFARCRLPRWRSSSFYDVDMR